MVVTTFVIISSGAVVWANGLRFNSSTGSFEQTLLIAIDGSPQFADVLLNGNPVATRIPYRIRNLLPGNYVVEISKTGFQSWKQSFWLSRGQVGLINDLTLIATKPLMSLAPSVLKIAQLERLDFGLRLEGGELTDNGKLITRFSVVPIQAHRFNNYYLYQADNELRLFLTEGNQDYLIYGAQTTEKLPLALYPSTWQVALTDGLITKFINLTIPSPASE